MAGLIRPLSGFETFTLRLYEDAENAPESPGGVLFQSMAFISHKGYDEVRIFDLTDESGMIRLRLSFAMAHGKWISLPGAPFSGPSWEEPLPVEGVLVAFLQACLAELSDGVGTLIHLMPEGYYLPGYERFRGACLAAGFEEETDSLNHHLALDKRCREDMHSMQRRRLRRATQAGLQFEKRNREFLEEALTLIADWRAKKRHSMSMTHRELASAFHDFPDHYHLFTVQKEERVLSILIAVTVSKDILYYFLPANNPEAGTLSPSVFLIEELSRWACGQGYWVLDLGTSMLPDDTVNEPLAVFKKRMGGIPSVRKTFHT
ncbi:GNAT family N-acetyltransferase [Roseivirga sp. BDSF3-8]|uniref:GNAT family N-acetyltransferase n=1 Tax=Roseivirga sp. BDSF3-8 TaxID=3241598 RepID=UPI003531C9C7